MKNARNSGYDPTRLAMSADLTSQGASANSEQKFVFRGKEWLPPAGLHWKTNVSGLKQLALADRIVSATSLSYLRFMDDFPAYPITNIWNDTVGQNQFGGSKTYVVQTALTVAERCLLMTTDPGDLVLDPTCGSGTTAYVAEQWGRRWITIDTSRVALAIARTRLMAARFPYYLLADTAEGVKKEAEIAGLVPPPYETSGDVRKGFVYKRMPHVTLKSIANNEEIDAIHARWQAQMEPLRAELNAAVGEMWEEWQVPREAGAGWSAETMRLHEQWWTMRRARQKEIDASIANTQKRNVPRRNCSTTSRMRTISASASPAPSPSKASRPTASSIATSAPRPKRTVRRRARRGHTKR